MPSPNPATRREHAGAAAAATLSTSMSSIDTTFTLSTATNWPTGAVGPFFVVIDPGTGTEEKVLCASRASTTVTVAGSGRGADGTVANSHSSGAVCYPCWTAAEADELNAHANASTDIHGITGALAAASSLAAKQPLDTELTALAALVSAADQLPYFTGSGTAALTTLSAFVRTLLDDANALTARTTLSAQAYATALDAIAQLTPAADLLPYFTSASAAATTTLTTFIRTLLDDVDAAAARATLGLAIGSNVQAWDADLDAFAALNTTAGFVIKTGANAYTKRTLVSDGSLTLGNVDGVAGNPTLVLTDPGVVTTTGFTAAAGWTLNSGTYHLIGGVIVFLHVQCTRTGATLTSDSKGNITDTDLLSAYPAAARPNRDLRALYAQSNLAFGTCVLTAAGVIQLETLVSNAATIASGDTVSVDYCYMVST